MRYWPSLREEWTLRMLREPNCILYWLKQKVRNNKSGIYMKKTSWERQGVDEQGKDELQRTSDLKSPVFHPAASLSYWLTVKCPPWLLGGQCPTSHGPLGSRLDGIIFYSLNAPRVQMGACTQAPKGWTPTRHRDGLAKCLFGPGGTCGRCPRKNRLDNWWTAPLFSGVLWQVQSLNHANQIVISMVRWDCQCQENLVF